jgi:hypothetical protein
MVSNSLADIIVTGIYLSEGPKKADLVIKNTSDMSASAPIGEGYYLCGIFSSAFIAHGLEDAESSLCSPRIL